MVFLLIKGIDAFAISFIAASDAKKNILLPQNKAVVFTSNNEDES
jgi:hypothetical protein